MIEVWFWLGVALANGLLALLLLVVHRAIREQLASRHEEQRMQERVHTDNDMPAPVYDLQGRRIR